MPSREIIDRFLAQQHIAIVGVSHNPKELANVIYRDLRDDHKTVYPVNSRAGGEVLEGDPAYASLADVPGPIDGVIVMVPAAVSADVVRQAVARGIPRVWLHRGAGKGAVSAEAVELCREHGIEVVDGACPLMFHEPVKNVHRFHRFFSGRRIAA